MSVTTAIPIITDRFTPPSALAEATKAIAAAGVADELLVWDQMTNFWPRQMWDAQRLPMAAALPDIDSYADAFAMSAYALAGAPGVGVAISTDAIRRGPAELMQTMMTLQSMTERRATLMIGAGEAKQVTPFGWKRSEGLARLEDQLKTFNAFWEAREPLDLEGNHWTMKQAWLGSARGRRPDIWALGGGPKLLDLATSYADGMAAIVPCVFATPEAFAESVASLKADLERKGRDPEAFEFGIWYMALVHEDEDVIDRALDDPFFRYMAGVFGRLDQASWREHGIEPPLPDNWHYAMKLRPVEWTDAQIDDLLARTTREMAELSFTHGTPEQVAAEVQQYVDAGATWVSVCDILPLGLDPADAQAGLGRNLEICGRLKGAARLTSA
jgi:phthiodiolone/phenolphthiodiolone dimycocerosates ketoreductase